MAKFLLHKDPRLFEPRPAEPNYKRCLGLDLGTNCGLAISDFVPGQPVRQLDLLLGQWDLSIGPYDSGALRHIRFKHFLSAARPDLVIYEEPKYTPDTKNIRGRGSGSAAIHAVLGRATKPIELLASLKTTLVVWCEERAIPCQGVPIQHIKTHATGNGNCGKAAMIAACNEKFGTEFSLEEAEYKQLGTDNIADAVFACDLGIWTYSDGMD